jgi:ADP-heptose:LPS heptosyltransferase
MFTHIVEHPYKTELISTQRWHCLKKAGFPGAQPEVHPEIPEAARRSVREKAGGAGGWIHISPFTTEDYKELPPGQIAEVLDQLHRRFPGEKIILTCSGHVREKTKMSALLAALNFQPWRVFAGELDLLELAALLQSSRLHLGGDSGGLHVAWMTGVPTVTWFRRYDGLPDWQPVGALHRSVVGERTPGGLTGIAASDLVRDVEELLTSAISRPV